MYEAVAETSVALFVRYGLVFVLAAFVLEGALVGKVIPTRVVFVAAVLAVGTDAAAMLSVAVVAVLGATLGQVLVFVLVRDADVSAEALPGGAELAADGRLARLLDRWGLAAVAVTNVLPLARGALTVPVAMTDEDALRFSASSLVGSSLYAVSLLAMVAGVEEALHLV